MLKPMFGYRAKYRKFDYPFRYYDPKEDERKKRRIKFKPIVRRQPKQLQKVISLAALLFMVVWIISLL